jgi:hypothetical protein
VLVLFQTVKKIIMKFAFILTVFCLAEAHGAVTVCPKKGSIAEGLQYHDDTKCDRAAYNLHKANVGRYARYQSYKGIGGVSTIPNQKTVTCPAEGARVNMKDAHTPNVGLDTVWFIQNHASTPVVVSYVNDNGMEVSARNPKISPSTSDPTAILKPSEWMAVYAFEGHEFVIREVLKSGIAGNVLLQHRTGLIPVGMNFMAHNNVSCPVNDIEPVVEDNGVITTAPIFKRTPTTKSRPCHTMDIGFRNVASCPLHAYYVNGEGNECTERFKFHLGVESQTSDFMKDWVSQTKFEGTFVGHTFHFRLASNPTILVDAITLQPVIVTDCPVSSASATAIVSETNNVNIMSHIGTVEGPNNTTDVYGIYDSLRQSVPFDKPVSQTI